MSLQDWRRIDVDQYDPENQYEVDELPDLKPNTSIAEIQAFTQELRILIQHMDIIQAFKLSIEKTPYGSSPEIIELFLKSIFEIFVSVKTNDVDKFINTNGLSVDDLDIIVKYLYTLMSKEWALKQSGLLLIWLDKIVEKVGEGPIIRYMSDPYKL